MCGWVNGLKCGRRECNGYVRAGRSFAREFRNRRKRGSSSSYSFAEATLNLCGLRQPAASGGESWGVLVSGDALAPRCIQWKAALWQKFTSDAPFPASCLPPPLKCEPSHTNRAKVPVLVHANCVLEGFQPKASQGGSELDFNSTPSHLESFFLLVKKVSSLTSQTKQRFGI